MRDKLTKANKIESGESSGEGSSCRVCLTVVERRLPPTHANVLSVLLVSWLQAEDGDCNG